MTLLPHWFFGGSSILSTVKNLLAAAGVVVQKQLSSMLGRNV
jgi:hypothetical protein